MHLMFLGQHPDLVEDHFWVLAFTQLKPDILQALFPPQGFNLLALEKQVTTVFIQAPTHGATCIKLDLFPLYIQPCGKAIMS